MTRLLTVLTLALVLLGTALAESSLAEVRAGAVTLSPYAGGYRFDEDQNLDSAPFYGLSLGYNFSRHWAGEFSGYYLETEFDELDIDVNVYGGKFDILYHFTPEKKATFFFAAGAGFLALEDDDDVLTTDVDGLFNYGIGLKAFLSPSVALRLDARHLVTIDNRHADGEEFSNYYYSGGLSFQMGGERAPAPMTDADGDGVADALDRCPGTPPGVTVDVTGCPLDTDGDGVYDYLDQCPGTPAGIVVTRTGCPVDTDRDGVADHLDRCPDTPAGTAVDAEGCPRARTAADSDGDGVEDNRDKCPGTPAGVPVNAQGCPRDSDGDGVFDMDDACPDTPAGTSVDATGCPVKKRAAQPAADARDALTLDIQFAPNRAQLDPASRAQLEEAAAFVRRYPGSRIRVEGYTDSVGTETYNLKLSQQRAESVRSTLAREYDIAPERIQAKGYGEANPVADNATPEGRLQNRRVVITILK